MSGAVIRGGGAGASARSVSEDGRASGTPVLSDSMPPLSKHGATMAEPTQWPVATEMKLVLSDGKIKTEMIRLPAESECCVIDTLRITLDESTIHRAAGITQISDEDVASAMSRILAPIFGFGISTKYDKGRDFYSDAWELGDNFGHFALGGARQNNTVLIAINGKGCLGAKPGWEHRLYEFLASPFCIRPVITRVDLAHDDFEGTELPVRSCVALWHEGGFDRFGNRPTPIQMGAWLSDDPNGHGLTFYVGTKRSSQMLRDYEKGKQLGAPDSPWVRSEVQFSNHDKVIPLDILIDPSSYFVAAYPCFQRFSPSRTGKKTEVVKRSVEAGIEHYIRHTRRSYGKFLRVARQIYGDEELLDLVQSESEEWPERLVWPDHQFVSPPIHDAPKPQPLSYLELISAAPSFGYRGDVFGFLDSLDQEK